MKIAYLYYSDGSYNGEEKLYHNFLPNNATWIECPFSRPFPKNKWPVFNKDTQSWELKPDYRKRDIGFQDEEKQEATQYWLPDDTWETAGREMKTVGDFPEGATTDKPEKPEELILEENWKNLRSMRDQKIADTDFMMLSDLNYTDEEKEKILAYRQALRDITGQEGAPWDGGGELTPWPTLDI